MAQRGTVRSSDIDDAFVPMITESRFTEEHATTMAALVRREDLEKGRGGSVKIPKYTAFDDAEDLAEGVDITQGQRVLDSLTTITPTEIGLKVVVTKRTVDTRRDDILEIIGKLAGDAMGRKAEKMALTMLDGFSNALGSAGTALTWEHIGAAKVAIRGGGGGAAALTEPAPMSSPIVGVFHPHQLWPLAKDLAPAGTYPVPSGLSAEIVKKGKVGKVADVPLFEAGLLTIDSSDDAKGGVFCKDALIGVMDEREEYQEFRGSLRAYEITMSRWLTFAEWNDAWGREMLFDAVMPVS
jgi:hypothetical protein